MTPEENKEFFEFTLPGIINLALRLPEIFTTVTFYSSGVLMLGKHN
jgi:hypothetical protein